MRKINAKLLLGLLIGSLVCTGAVFGVHHFQYRRIADSLLWQARRAEEQGQVKRQAKYLQRYLEFNPKDLAEKAHLAQLWAGDAFAGSNRERLKAVNLLDQVLTRGEDRPELRRLLVKVALEMQVLKMARTHLEKLLPWQQLQPTLAAAPAPNIKTDPEHGEAEGYWGELLEAEGKKTQAIACCRLAVRHAPRLQANYVRLAQLLREQKEIDLGQQRKNQHEADQTLDELVQNNPLSHEAYLARWRYRRDFGLINLKDAPADGQVTLKDAANDVAQALQRAPESVDALLAAADLERLEGQVAFSEDAAAQDKEKRLIEHRDKALAYLNHGLKLHARGGRLAATDMTQFRLLWHKANLLLDDIKRLDTAADGAELAKDAAGQRATWVAEVAQAIDQIRKTRGSPAAADYLKARLLLQDHRWAEAVTLFEQVRPALGTQPDLASQINLYLGQCYEQLEEPGQMFNAYERLAQSEPNSVVAMLGMAQAEWTNGHLDSAADKFRQLAVTKRMPDKVWLDYARLEIQRQAQQDTPNWSIVEWSLENAKKATPDSIDVPLVTAQMWMVQKNLDQAREVLDKARHARPREIELRTARINLELRDKKFDEARKVLAEAKRELGDRVLLRLSEARLLAEEGPKSAEAAINALVEKIEQFKEEDQARLLSGLADVQLSLENVKAARQLWQRVAKLPSRRTDLRLHLLLFDLAVKAEDEDGMRRTLEEIRTVEGSQGAFHRYGEALRLIWQARKKPDERTKSLDEAQAHLDRVQSVRPTWPPLFLARAQIARMNGQWDQAIRNLQEAIQNGERSPAVIRDLVELLANEGRYKEADEALHELREPLLVNSDLGRLAATVALGLNDKRKALERLDKNRVEPSAKNYRELLWEGRMLAEVNKVDEAEKKLREALKLADKEPEPYVALVQFLARQKRDDQADAVLKQARERLPAERAALALAQCEEALGRQKSAQARYEEALQSHRQDATIVRRVASFYWNGGQLTEAEPLLRDIIGGRVKNPTADDVNWARWHLALSLASGTDYGRFREALELVGLKLDGNGQLARDQERGRTNSTDARRFQARVLAAQAGHRPYRQRALELLEELERTKALRPDDRFILAMLYEAEGAWPKAKPILLELASGREPAPRHLAHFVQALIEHQEIEEAGKWVDRLEELEQRSAPEPNAFAAVELRARLLEAQGKGDAALDRLEKLVRRPKAHADEVLLVLNAMRRQKKFAAAFDRCQKTWAEKKCSPAVIGGASVALLRSMQAEGAPATDAQVSLIEARLKEALQAQSKREDRAVLMLHLADLYDQRGRWEQAEAMYRQVLRPENEPKNIVALNNLAWLLAQRYTDQQKVREGLEKIEAAVNGIGRRADLLDTRGLVYLKLGQEAAALADFREAAADMPTPAHLFHLARAHFQARDKNNAFKVLKQAKDQGLHASALHPVEQEAFQRLLEELKVR
jgi:tetratricopeptide (TPR) repeat protein